MRLDAGFDNLTNRKYDLPLGWPVLVGDKRELFGAGMGRSLYSRADVEF